ncbi:hypothetical protein ACTXT7_010754 [Hymenolepis weldensis]
MAARRLLAGFQVGDHCYEPNPEWCKWARENGCFPTEAGVENQEELEHEEEIGRGEVEALSLDKSEEIESALSEDLSFSSSETVPSFAKIRYSIDDRRFPSQELYLPVPFSGDFQKNRITIQEPGSKRGTIFYFIEMLGHYYHQEELGNCYKSLFSANVMEESQMDPETRQTSQFCHWQPIQYFPENTVYTQGSYSSTVSLNYINRFSDRKSLTWDFCENFLEGTLGLNIIFNKLFSEKFCDAQDIDEILDEDGGEVLLNMFSSEPSDHGNNNAEQDQEAKEGFIVEIPEPEVETEPFENFVELYEESEEYDIESNKESEEYDIKSYEESKKGDVEEMHMQVEYSSTETSNPVNHYVHSLPMRQCPNCVNELWPIELLCALEPALKWVFYRTRWPVRFSPQQKVELSMNGINIPPWRASSALMLSDICRYCAKNESVENLALLDPLTISPLSPLLNLMQYSKEPKAQLIGILWMTPVDAISPFYLVPIPLEKSTVYPPPMKLRFLTVGAFLTNWVSWISRMETYSARGKSRFSPNLDSSLAAGVLEPMTMGCGQTPFFDLWPLWTLRSILNLSLRLSHCFLPFFKSNIHLLFPFSDIDEI